MNEIERILKEIPAVSGDQIGNELWEMWYSNHDGSDYTDWLENQVKEFVSGLQRRRAVYTAPVAGLRQTYRASAAAKTTTYTRWLELLVAERTVAVLDFPEVPPTSPLARDSFLVWLELHTDKARQQCLESAARNGYPDLIRRADPHYYDELELFEEILAMYKEMKGDEIK